MLRGFIKGVSGGCFVLKNKLHYPQSAITKNPGLTDEKKPNFFKSCPKSSTKKQFRLFKQPKRW